MEVRRATPGVQSGKLTQPAASPHLASVPCLVEPLATLSRDTVLGRHPQARFRVSWGEEDVRNNDQVTVQTGPVSAVGRTFVLVEHVDDTGRPNLPYQTGILVERK